MKKLLSILTKFTLVCALSASASYSVQAQNAPFVDFSNAAQDDTLGVAGFPALEILPADDINTAMIVARESNLKGNITYSSSYFTPAKKFTPPTYFNFTLYGYHDEPIWKAIESVNFKFAGQTFVGKSLYGVQGPDRDRSQDAQKSNYFELMTIRIPAETARKIANNGGLLITTTPNSFYLQMTASQLDNFKQVVNSVNVIGKNQKAKQSVPQQPQKAISAKKMFSSSGLPITEAFEDTSGSTTLETEMAAVSDNLLVQGKAWVAMDGKKLKPPYTAIGLSVVSQNPIWADVKSVTLSFGSKKLRLNVAARSARRANNGASIESLSVRMPYKDFLILAKGGKFYITIKGANFEVSGKQTAGFRELANRISP